MTRSFRILFGDDDHRFLSEITSQVTSCIKQKNPDFKWEIVPLSSLSSLRHIVTNPHEAKKWDMIVCDLGWGEYTLEGIPILHDMQMNHPHIITVLYTAQDANQAVDQALEWQLHFIDRVLRLDGGSPFCNNVVSAIEDYLVTSDSLFSDDVQFSATNLLPASNRLSVVELLGREAKRIQRNLYADLPSTQNPLAFDILIAPHEINVRFRSNPVTEQQKRIAELIKNKQNFPRIAPHDLLPLSKSGYIAFIKETYGGFPQMAKARSLDLNNIYRANRRFKNAPFIVFKYETIREIVGIYDVNECETQIKKMLCPRKLLHRTL